MLKKKCSLCGGPLEGGRCTLCGLDNSVYERETAALRAAADASRRSVLLPDSRIPGQSPPCRSRKAGLGPKEAGSAAPHTYSGQTADGKDIFPDGQAADGKCRISPGRAGSRRQGLHVPRPGDDHGRIIAGKLARTFIIAVILVAVVSVGRSLFRDNFSSGSSDAFSWGDLDGWNVDFSDTDDMGHWRLYI